MNVWIVSQAWEGEIVGVYGDQATAEAVSAEIRSNPRNRPCRVEEWPVTFQQVEQAASGSSTTLTD